MSDLVSTVRQVWSAGAGDTLCPPSVFSCLQLTHLLFTADTPVFPADTPLMLYDRAVSLQFSTISEETDAYSAGGGGRGSGRSDRLHSTGTETR